MRNVLISNGSAAGGTTADNTLAKFLKTGFFSRRFWLILLVSIGVAWRLGRYFLNFPIFGDEAVVGLNILDRSYLGLLEPLRYIQACPFGFLWISKWIIIHFGTSSFAVRFLPLVASLVSLLLIYPIARQFGGPWIALLATGLLACSLSPARFSNDFKPYSIDLLVALSYTGLGLWALRSWRDGRPVLLLAVLTPIALALSYPSVFVAGAVSLALGLRYWRFRSASTRNRTLGWYLLFNLLLVGGFVALYFTVSGGQLHTTRHDGILRAWGQAFPPLNWHIAWWLVKAQFGNMMSYPMGGEWGISLVISPLCWLGAWRLWRRGQRAEVVLLVAPFLATLIASCLRAYPYGRDARVEQHLVPAIMLLSSLGLFNAVVFLLRGMKTRGRGIRAVVAGVGALWAIFAVVAAIINVFNPWISRGWQRSQRIAQNVCAGNRQNTQIVILGQMPSNVEWYLRRKNVSWLPALPLHDSALQKSRCNLWVLCFSPRPKAHFLTTIRNQLAARKVSMELVKLERIRLDLGSAPSYAKMFHFTHPDNN